MNLFKFTDKVMKDNFLKEKKMESADVKRFGLLLAVQAEIEGMKFENKLQLINYEDILYNENHFRDKAEELRNIVHCNDLQL